MDRWRVDQRPGWLDGVGRIAGQRPMMPMMILDGAARRCPRASTQHGECTKGNLEQCPTLGVACDKEVSLLSLELVGSSLLGSPCFKKR
jgi:hypothetical protein